MKQEYEVKPVKRPICGTVRVPGSKSITNRALLLAALSEGYSTLTGVLFSDDSRYFLNSLKELGFEVSADEERATVVIKGCGGKIPAETGTINVGSAGTAARFLTALTALSDGEYVIECSEQMSKRPMKELFRVLTEMGAEFEYYGEPGYLPARVMGNSGRCRDITMDISGSTQFLSAMLMVTPVTEDGIRITIPGGRKNGSYIEITRRMMAEFGIDSEFDGSTYHVRGNQKVRPSSYAIEPDVSAACYFYAAAAVTGGSVTVENVFFSSIQGDIEFIRLLEKMGCNVTETAHGIRVDGPSGGRLHGVKADMKNYSDQALTLAALAPYADKPVIIENVGHIRGQECNRMEAIVSELSAAGIKCRIHGDDIHITPGKVSPARINTHDDHRVAMAMSLLGLRSEGIVIDNPSCCRKTFENYFEVLDDLLKENGTDG